MSISAAELVSSRKHILLDFDGPICAAFAGYGAENISRQLATLIAMEGVDVPAELRGSSDPFELLHYAAATGDADLLIDVAAEFQRLEVLAAQIAPACLRETSMSSSTTSLSGNLPIRQPAGEAVNRRQLPLLGGFAVNRGTLTRRTDRALQRVALG